MGSAARHRIILLLLVLGATVAGVVWFTTQRSIEENRQHASGSQRHKLDATDVMKALIMYLQVRTRYKLHDITCAMNC
jgi:uncharacterized protein HemX